MRSLITVLAACLCWTSLGAAPIATAGEPKLNYFFPAGGQRGQTVEVEANGSWDTWPVTAWVSRPGIEVTATEKGKLKLALAADAEPGIAWLRLVNADGATVPKPFVVGTLPELVEQEPNDDPAKPQSLDKSAVVNGRLNKREDVDTYAIHLSKGQTLVASIRANMELGVPLDAVVQICSARRFVLEQNDDARGMDPLATLTAPADGDYLVRVFGFPTTPDSSIAFTGGDAMIYRLTITTGPFVDHTLPLAIPRGESREVELAGWNLTDATRRTTVPATDRQIATVFHAEVANEVPIAVVPHASVLEEPGTSRDQPQRLTLPTTVSGLVESPGDEDVFLLNGVKGKAVLLDLESDELGYLLDGIILVLDATGKVLSETDDAKKARDPQVVFSPPADGEFRVIVKDVHGHGGPRYAYRLTARESAPSFAVQLKAENFRGKAGESVEVEVTIDRQRGFDGELEVTAQGLPTGVSADPAKSAAKGDSAKSVKLALRLSPEAQGGPFTVVARPVGGPPLEREASLPNELPLPAWLSVGK